MRRRSLRRRLFPPVLIALSVLVGWGCGVVNPDLLGTIGFNTASSSQINGVVVIMVVNETDAAAQATVTVTKTTETQTLTTTNQLSVGAQDHLVVVDDCDVDTIQVDQGSYAGPNGAVLVPATVSPVQMGVNLQCGGGVIVTFTGTPPGVFLNAFSF